MNLNFKQNGQAIASLAEKFITVAEDLKAVYEQSKSIEGGAQTKAYLLTNIKIIYVEIQKDDAFIKCYPLNKAITYQMEKGKYRF